MSASMIRPTIQQVTRSGTLLARGGGQGAASLRRSTVAAAAAATPAINSIASFSTTPLPRAANKSGEVDETHSPRTFPTGSSLPPAGESKGPEYIQGDEGSHSARTLKSFSMAGKVCVVTGGARGLGNLMARALVESGCDKLAILDLDPKDAQGAAEAMTEWIEGDGQGVKKGQVDVRGFKCDVADEGSVKKAFEEVKGAFGPATTVINSAGIVENFPALEYPTDRMQKLYAINVFGSHYVSREAARHMIDGSIQGGSIILVASMSGSIVNIPQPQAPYNASKAAVKHLGACLAVEWAKHGIRVNTLSPGYMLTSLTQQMFDRNAEGKMLRKTWEGMIPMGKMGMPEDLKGAAVYLASDASRYTTGADLIVDGGYTST